MRLCRVDVFTPDKSDMYSRNPKIEYSNFNDNFNKAEVEFSEVYSTSHSKDDVPESDLGKFMSLCRCKIRF